MRIITDLNQPAIDALKWICENYKISRAEAIRRAVMEKAETEMELEKNKHARKQAALAASFGLWKEEVEIITTDLIEEVYESAA